MSGTKGFDPLPVLEALSSGEVDFVVVGGVAGGVHGSSDPTYDLDIAYCRGRGNPERLAAVLSKLGATVRGAPADLPFRPDADTLQAGAHFTFTTRWGPLDTLDRPDGSPPHGELKHASKDAHVRGRPVKVASLDNLSDALRAPRE